jgi:hypothetical protein
MLAQCDAKGLQEKGGKGDRERRRGLAFSPVLFAGGHRDVSCTDRCRSQQEVFHDSSTGGAASFSCGQTDVDEILTPLSHLGHFLSRWNIQTCVRVGDVQSKSCLTNHCW